MQTAAEPQIEFDEAKHEYTVGGIVRPSVTQILRAVGILRFGAVGQELHNEVAMARGRAVHRATELLDLGRLDWVTVNDSIMPQVLAYQDALEAFGLKPIPEYIERRVFHPVHGYAGTIDRLYLSSPGRCPILADIKTGESVPKHAAIQTAAYAMALLASGLPYRNLSRIIIQLREDGSFSVVPCDGYRDEQIWLSSLNVYNFNKNP